MSHPQNGINPLDPYPGNKHAVSAEEAKDDVVTSCFHFLLCLNLHIKKPKMVGYSLLRMAQQRIASRLNLGGKIKIHILEH